MSIKTERPHTILIVDDVIQNIQLLSVMLRNEYQIIYALNGKDALALAEKNFPDLILLDVMMPDMSGYEVCRILKNDDALRNIPVIFVTALSDDDSESDGLRVGAVDYIRKPYNIDIVRLRVKNHLELKKYRDELFKLSNIDRLTGISNRRSLENYLETELARAKRGGTEIGVIMLDIDFFKSYNDSYGHLAGDGSLSNVAQAISNALLRPADLAGRYGGEEFLCILPETGSSGLKTVGERMLQNIRDLLIIHSYSKIEKIITASAGGYSTIPDKSYTSKTLLNCADKALYQSKNNGRNKLTLWTND